MVCRRFSGRVSRPINISEKLLFDTDKKGKKSNYHIVKTYPVRDDGSVIQLDVDQFSGQPFMQNPNGFITNDIMMFEECQSDSVARAIINRLKILHPESIDQKLSLDEMMARVVPSNYGSPAEFVSAHRMMAQKAYKFYEADCKVYQDMMAAKAAEVAKSESESLSGSVPNPE